MVIKSDEAKGSSSPNINVQTPTAESPEASASYGFQMPGFGRGMHGGFRGRHPGHHNRPEVVSLEGDQPNHTFWAQPSIPDPPLAPLPPVAPDAPQVPPPFGFGRPGYGPGPHPFDIPAGIASFIGDLTSHFIPPPPGSPDHHPPHHRGPMGHPGSPRGRRGGPMGWRMRGRGGGGWGWGGPGGPPHEHHHGHHEHHHHHPPPPPPGAGHFPGFPHHEHGPIRPKMNIQHDGKLFTVTVELPGLQKEQVDLSVADGVLTISGEFVDTTPGTTSFPPEYEAEGFDLMDESGETLYGDDEVTEGVAAMNLNPNSGDCGLVLRERRFGPFKRSVKLPAWVNVDTIKATMAHGVLSLTIEKPEEGEKNIPARKINVL